jgi:hypothetical protein
VWRAPTPNRSRAAGLVARHLDLRLAALHTVGEERRLRGDPDERAATAGRLAETLRAAAAAHASRPTRPQPARRRRSGNPPAAVKTADAWGDSAWGCMSHVAEAILNVTSVFIANEDLGGLDAYVHRR